MKDRSREEKKRLKDKNVEREKGIEIRSERETETGRERKKDRIQK